MSNLAPPSELASNLVEMRRFLPEGTPDVVVHSEKPKALLSATPFKWKDPRTIPPREWVYGRHYVRQFISTTVAPGGVGKSSLSIVEALAIATGRELLGIKPDERTRVWLWNGEDPMDELERRVGAAMMQFDIAPEEIEGWLFLDSGRTSEIVIATTTKNGAELALPVVAALEETIMSNRIGVVILDPFVSVHRVSENDNGQIEMVAKAFARIADRTNSSIDLVHHVRKTNGAEVTVEDARGAVSMLGAVRAARAINQMTQDEADKWGVENRRLHFRCFDGKANLAPPSEKSIWFKLASVNLENGTEKRPSDIIGVVTRWEPPKPFDDVTTDHMHEVRRRVGEGQWRLDPQSGDWVGKCAAEVLGLDLSDKAAKSKVKTIIKTWIDTGALATEERKDSKRNLRTFVVPGPFEGQG
ncbi:helicase RepA family protein (plasmid) [Microvirga terrae]|uniref:Helicase RepA family protein n=1 Tax=Microvirga terrae TaxID=2740529 RepID=A0ABY5S3V9_9HYPH|nr:AAA family ATPase [Microvirga terrae]UVF22869.1 helicase RepA family protein [Microvirga terrae]